MRVVRRSSQGDHPTPGRGQAMAYSHQLKEGDDKGKLNLT